MSAAPPVQPVPPASQPSSADPTTAAAAVSTNGGDPSSSTTVSSLSDLKNQAPKVYYQMMVSIATSMISDMHNRDERLKQMWRDARDESNA